MAFFSRKSGATPLAAIAVHKGLSAGAAVAFLLAGPSTNLTTFGVLAALHGRAVALRFGLTLTGVAILVGWGVDLAGVQVPDAVHAAHAEEASALAVVAGGALLALAVASLFRQGPRGALDAVLSPVHDH